MTITTEFPAPVPPGTAGLILREWRMELIKSLRTPEYAIPTVIFPVMFFGLFGIALARGPEATGYLMATYGVFAALGPAIFGFGTGVAFEREQGLLALKRIAPLPAAVYPAAKLLACLTMVGVTLAGLYVLAVFVGGAQVPAARWPGLVAVHLASVIPFALIGLTIGFLLRSQGAMAVANVLFFLLCILGGLWMPLHILPAWMGEVAVLLPSYHLGELALTAAGVDRPHGIGFHLGAILLWTVALTGVAGLAVRRAED